MKQIVRHLLDLRLALKPIDIVHKVSAIFVHSLVGCYVLGRYVVAIVEMRVAETLRHLSRLDNFTMFL